MGKLVEPKVFFVGYTTVDVEQLAAYLEHTGQQDFLETFREAVAAGISPGEALCSFYSKICYKALVVGKNANVSRVRDIQSNLEATLDAAHMSVFEHCQLNFMITDCSRVFTHELCRHRIGTAFSQTSGRFCRLDNIDLVWDPILEGCDDLVRDHVSKTEDTVYLMECRLGLRKPPNLGLPHPDKSIKPTFCLEAREHGRDDWEKYRWVPDNSFDFDKRKKITSAIRRIAPNGQSNEIGFSVNLRALRQIVQVRTAAGAEREIRLVFNQIYHLVKDRFPMIFYKARIKEVDGLLAISGMKCQPYELAAGDPAALQFSSVDELKAEVAKRASRL